MNWQKVAQHLRAEAEVLLKNIEVDYTNSPHKDQWACTAALCQAIARALEAGEGR